MPTTKSKKKYKELQNKLCSKYQTKTVEPYQFWAQVIHIVDGDTLDLEVALGFELKVKNRFRLLGVDAPEMHGVKHNSSEYKQGVASKKALSTFTPRGAWVEVKTFAHKREKYGRWLCILYKDGKDINRALIDQGYAQSFE